MIKKRFEVRAFKECPVTGESKEIESDFDSLKIAKECAKIALTNGIAVLVNCCEDLLNGEGRVIESTRVSIYEPMGKGWEVIEL